MKTGEFMSERFPYVRGAIRLTNVPLTATLEGIEDMPVLEIELEYKGGYRTNETAGYTAEKDAGGGWTVYHAKTYEDMTSGRDARPAMVRFHLMGVQPLVSATADFAAVEDRSKMFIAGSFVAQMPNDAGLWGVSL